MRFFSIRTDSYTPLTSSLNTSRSHPVFSPPKYVIKAKDPQLQKINITMPRFLASPPPKGTQQVELLIQRVTKEEATSSHPSPEEKTTKIIEVVDFEEDFKVFD